MSKLLAAWKTLSLPSQVAIGVGILVVLALLLGGTTGIVSKYKDKKFDKEIQTLKTERQALIDKADAAEEKAKALEADKIKFQLALEVAEKQGVKAQEKIADAQKTYDETIASIDVDTDACQRYAMLRAKLGLKPAECKATE